MATAHDYTVGTNAAMHVAQDDIDGVAGVFAAEIPLPAIEKFVADVVKAALDAVDAAGAANLSPPPSGDQQKEQP